MYLPLHCLLAWVGVSDGNGKGKLAFWEERIGFLGFLGIFELKRAFYAFICYAADET